MNLKCFLQAEERTNITYNEKSVFSIRRLLILGHEVEDGASLFNSLPSELKDIGNHSINFYKNKHKTYFLQLNREVDHIN